MNRATRALAPSTLDGAPAFIGMCDAQFRPSYLNPAGRTLVSFPEATELTTVNISDFFVRENRKLIDVVGLPTMAREGRWEQDLRFRDWQDPTHELDVRCSIFGLYDEHRHFLAGVTITQEIKTPTKAAQAIREGRAMADALLDLLPIGVGVFDAAGRLRHSNDQWRRRGVLSLPPRAPTASQQWKQRAERDDGRLVQEPGLRALRGERVPDANILHAPDEGTPGWVRVSAAPLGVSQEAPSGAVLVLQDVDEHQRTQAALARSEARLSVAAEVAGLGFFSFDPMTGAFEWDNRLRKLWGLANDCPVDWQLMYDLIHPNDAARVRAVIGNCMSAGRAQTLTINYRIVRRDDGRVRPMSTALRSIFQGPMMTTLVGATQASGVIS